MYIGTSDELPDLVPLTRVKDSVIHPVKQEILSDTASTASCSFAASPVMSRSPVSTICLISTPTESSLSDNKVHSDVQITDVSEVEHIDALETDESDGTDELAEKVCDRQRLTPFTEKSHTDVQQSIPEDIEKMTSAEQCEAQNAEMDQIVVDQMTDDSATTYLRNPTEDM